MPLAAPVMTQTRSRSPSQSRSFALTNSSPFRPDKEWLISAGILSDDGPVTLQCSPWNADMLNSSAHCHEPTHAPQLSFNHLVASLFAVIPDIGCELPVASNLLPHHEIFAGDFFRHRTL